MNRKWHHKGRNQNQTVFLFFSCFALLLFCLEAPPSSCLLILSFPMFLCARATCKWRWNSRTKCYVTFDLHIVYDLGVCKIFTTTMHMPPIRLIPSWPFPLSFPPPPFFCFSTPIIIRLQFVCPLKSMVLAHPTSSLGREGKKRRRSTNNTKIYMVRPWNDLSCALYANPSLLPIRCSSCVSAWLVMSSTNMWD